MNDAIRFAARCRWHESFPIDSEHDSSTHGSFADHFMDLVCEGRYNATEVFRAADRAASDLVDTDKKLRALSRRDADAAMRQAYLLLSR
jgi:hypothetical protein